jgi:(p)ppGpp synthase/HD superfamily hydrolase
VTRLGTAIALASDVHKNQVDKAGVTYILHPLAVMQRATDYYVSNSDGWKLEEVQIVAVLHDALEDIDPRNSWDKDRLRQRIYDNFGDMVHQGVEAITKRPKDWGETYEEYLERVSKNWIARIVKIADLSHNLDAFRLPTKIGERDFERWDKYHRALVFLVAIEANVRKPVKA